MVTPALHWELGRFRLYIKWALVFVKPVAWGLYQSYIFNFVFFSRGLHSCGTHVDALVHGWTRHLQWCHGKRPKLFCHDNYLVRGLSQGLWVQISVLLLCKILHCCEFQETSCDPCQGKTEKNCKFFARNAGLYKQVARFKNMFTAGRQTIAGLWIFSISLFDLQPNLAKSSCGW